jgi:putative phosphoribosyl transferase
MVFHRVTVMKPILFREYAPAVFRDRVDAGKQLASRIMDLGPTHPIVFAIPRGGVPVGHEVALALNAPLTLLFTSQIGLAEHTPELAMAAAGDGRNTEVAINWPIIRTMRLGGIVVDDMVRYAHEAIRESMGGYPNLLEMPALEDRTAIIVSDALTTPLMAEAAVSVLRKGGARRIVAAAPIASRRTLDALRRRVDAVIAVISPDDTRPPGMFYEHFPPIAEAHVADIVKRAAALRRWRHPIAISA